VLKTIQKFKLVLMSAALLLAGWLYIRLTFARLGQEKQKVRELVELALKKLRDEASDPKHFLSKNPPHVDR
jgi:recombinational DNA repair protein (RecF pathway)